MKKSLSMVLAAMLMFCFCGCGSNESMSQTENDFVVKTSSGEDITDRFVELWDYANQLYRSKDPFADDVLYTTFEDGNQTVSHAVIENFHEQIPSYFSTNGQAELMSTRDATTFSPLFIESDGKVYYRVSMMTEENVGEALDATVVDETDGSLILAVKYTDPAWHRIDGTSKEEYEYNFFELAKVDGIWLIDSYHYPTANIVYS